ncbi:hypothetical protein J25TS5_27180 [Paenibacillus faecis]|uniref:DUF4097 family beta strand repeat-containing protein n=1 Tax=Paenibacillus faecis TaxID=862114 RepID=UPI001B2962FC|nr:DUF4097 family beta strand repeat-containing protein [Paenibacillus faecis]GIO85786.1 hypothetical protein J25TS5_27180 [Paenibacillus faecis]
MTRRLRNITRLALLLIAVSVIGNAVMYLLGNSPFNLGDLSVERTVDAELADQIRIETETEKMEVLPIKGDEIRAVLRGKTTKKWLEDYRIDIVEDQGSIRIKVIQDSRFRFFDFYTDLKLTVGIPEKKLSRLQVVSDTGDISIDSVSADIYSAVSDTGSIRLDIQEGEIQARTDTGTIAVSLRHIAHDIHAETDSGDITIQTALIPQALRTKLSAGSGKTDVSLPHYRDGGIGEGGPWMELVSDTGNLTVKQSNELQK